MLVRMALRYVVIAGLVLAACTSFDASFPSATSDAGADGPVDGGDATSPLDAADASDGDVAYVRQGRAASWPQAASTSPPPL